MNINTIFARVTSAFNTQMDAHLRAIAEGKQTATEAPTDRGVLLYATAGTMDYANRYTIRSYRIPGQRECTLPVTERPSVKQTEIDQAAAAYGYGLEGPPDRGYIYTLRYLPKGAIKPAANQSPAARAATANSRQAAAMTASGNATSSVMPKNPTLVPPEQRIKVINVAGMPANSPGIWYCGRQWAGWKAGVLANRHHMKSEANRGEAAEKFDGDLFADIQRQGPMYWELRAIQRKLEAGETVTLGCWCAPKVCHCDTIRKAVLRLMAGQPAATTPTAPTATTEQPAPQSATKPNPARAAAAAASATQAMAEPSAE